MSPAEYRLGMFRRRSPAATLAAIRPIATQCGVTRLADVTGLDVIGVPVFQAIRPMGRSLSVSQGKGLTRVAARVSALMEAIELHCAETVSPDRQGMSTTGEHAFRSNDTGDGTDWCRGIDLVSGRATRVPHALVSMDYTQPDPHRRAASNGLASGNDRTEAIVSALCEVIERDAQSRWLRLSGRERQRRAIDLSTITTPVGRRLLRLFRAAGLGVQLWSFGESHGIAAIACALTELSPNPVLAPVMGAGAHLDPVVALSRAMTEAAQVRATLIAGARDDLTDADYVRPEAMRLNFLVNSVIQGRAAVDWASLETRSSGCLARDADTLVRAAERAGATSIPCVDLAPASWPVAVVKLVVPGFLGHCDRRTGV